MPWCCGERRSCLAPVPGSGMPGLRFCACAGAPGGSACPSRSSAVLRWCAADVGSRSFPRSEGGDGWQLDCQSNDCDCCGTRGRAALTRTYLGVSRAAEILGCTQGWLWRLRSEDPDFPAHAVEIHEPKAVFHGWTERSMRAYRTRRTSRHGQRDPRFPRAEVRLLERTRVREGYNETAARDYASQRSPKPWRR